jgi:hypothetical protein
VNQLITVPKDQLIEILMQNRDKHQEVFLAALEGYREHVLKWLNKTIREARMGRLPALSFAGRAPADHTRDYDRLISMLGWHTGDTFDLDEHDYAQFILDDWGWKRQFLDTSSAYAAATVTEVYGAAELD